MIIQYIAIKKGHFQNSLLDLLDIGLSKVFVLFCRGPRTFIKISNEHIDINIFKELFRIIDCIQIYLNAHNYNIFILNYFSQGMHQQEITENITR